MHRINNIVAQLDGNFTRASSFPKSDNDVVIVSSVRTAICKARRGEFATLPVEELLAPVLKAVLDQTSVAGKDVGDIVVGSVLGQNVQRANEVRIAQFLAGIPNTVPIHTVNRQCGSGMQAVAEVAACIEAGQYDIGIAAGVESMSTGKMAWEGQINPKIFLQQQAKDVLLPMGITSENVAKKYGITRKEQDELAVLSHQRAYQATLNGRFQDEIIPVTVTIKDKKTGKIYEKIVDKDGGIRESTTLAGLSKLKAAFMKNGSTHAGNASQVSDGAAATLLMTRKKANELGLSILGRYLGYAVAGVPPNIMGIGPAVAIPKVLKLVGLDIKDIDLFEINEAFASQAVYTIKHLNIDYDKVNVNGGAIALGHPLGATGCRFLATLLHEMKKRKNRYGIAAACIGSGMGFAAIFENEL